MLDVRRLRLLRELAHRGTIAAVADALGYTASAVSQQLSALERESGTELLVRSGRRVTLTPAAHALTAHAEVVLAELERAETTLAALRGAVTGPLRIGAYPSAARSVLPTALAALARTHPRLEPAVRELDPAAVNPALRTGDLDVALTHAYDLVPDRVAEVTDAVAVFEETMHLAEPRTWAPPPRRADPIHHRRDAAWILAPPDTACGAMTLRLCQAAGFTPTVRHIVDDFDAALAFVGIGAGVALVPDLGINRRTRGVRLTSLPLHRRTLVAFRPGAETHPRITALIGALREAAGERAITP